MEITVELVDFLKQYYNNKKVVTLKIEENEITLDRLKEMVNIPKELVVVAVSSNKVIDFEATLKGEKVKITLIPPVNGG